MTIQQAAITYISLGLSVVPTNPVNKRPFIKWEEYQQRIMLAGESLAHFHEGVQVAIVCGAVSKGLEIIDVDCKHDLTGNLWANYHHLINQADPDLYEKLLVETTKNGGYHLVYRCSVVAGNQKLAKRPASLEELASHNAKVERKLDNVYDLPQDLIETRGEGGYFVAAPSPGYEIIQGSFDAIPVLTPAERQTLLDAAKSLNEWFKPSIIARSGQPTSTEPDLGGLKPGDDYDQRADVADRLEALLVSHGWMVTGQMGDTIRFKRPGDSDSAYSASWNQVPGKFWCWSTSTVFDAQKPYKPYAVYAMLEHGGDFGAAAKALYEQGYGDRVKAKPADPKPKAERTDSTKEGKADDRPTDKLFAPAQEFLELYHNIRQNEVSLFFEDNGIRLDDKQLNGIYVNMRRSGLKISFNDMLKLIDSPDTPSYHPIKEFIEYHDQVLPKNPQGEHEQINMLINCILPNKPGYNPLFIKKWLVGMVATLYTDRANVLMLVLTGGINTGKTYFFEHLLPAELMSYYAPSKLDQGKDSDALMCNKLLILNDELDGMTNYEAKTFRNFISASRYTYRPPYARNDITRQRMATLSGTSNEKGIIADYENNRRIIPITVEEIDKRLYNSIDKTALLIEAYRLYKSGYRWELSSDDVALLQVNTIDNRAEALESQVLQKYFKIPESEAHESPWTNGEILAFLSEKTKLKLKDKALGSALREMGFKVKTKKIKGSKSTRQVYLVQQVTQMDDIYERDPDAIAFPEAEPPF